MEWIIIIIVVIAVLSPIVGLLFWYFVIRAVVNHAQAFEKEQRDLIRLINKYSQENYSGQVPTNVSNEVYRKLSSMQNHMGQMDHLRRQQYETKMTGMTSSVIGAGFTNFDPSDYY